MLPVTLTARLRHILLYQILSLGPKNVLNALFVQLHLLRVFLSPMNALLRLVRLVHILPAT